MTRDQIESELGTGGIWQGASEACRFAFVDATRHIQFDPETTSLLHTWFWFRRGWDAGQPKRENDRRKKSKLSE